MTALLACTSAGVPLARTDPKSSTHTFSHSCMTRGTSCSTSRIAHAGAGQPGEQPGERLGLGLVLTGCRLVEQQQPRAGGERATQLDEPGQARRQLVGPGVGDVAAPRRGR